MNTLSFRCTLLSGASPLPTVDVTPVLDGRPLPGRVVDVTGLLFGGAQTRSTYAFFTCSCGIAGCAGYHEPLEQHRANGTVSWTIADTQLAKDFGTNALAFEEQQFDAALAQLRADIIALEAEGAFATAMQDLDYDADDQGVYVGTTLAQIATQATTYYAQQQAMLALRDRVADPANPGIVRFSFDSGDDPHAHFAPREAVDVAATLLCLGHTLRPEDAPRAAALPEATAIIRTFAATQDTAAAETAFTPLRRFLQEEGMDTPEAALFGIDNNGPFVRHP